jgi:hypothetical protein
VSSFAQLIAISIPRWPWQALVAAVALNLLVGCAASDDFGRMRSSALVANDLPARMGPAALRITNDSVVPYPLTEDERLLRELAYPLIELSYDRDKFYGVLGDVGPIMSRPRTYPDRTIYASQLFQMPHRSQTARYHKLIEDIRSDVGRVDPFFRMARQVADMDRKRTKSLTHVTTLTAEQRSKATQRMEENKAIVSWVRESLLERAASYQIALERLVIAAPSPIAVEAERSLSLLQQSSTNQGV